MTCVFMRFGHYLLEFSAKRGPLAELRTIPHDSGKTGVVSCQALVGRKGFI